jgi:hypothetical protein
VQRARRFARRPDPRGVQRRTRSKATVLRLRAPRAGGRAPAGCHSARTKGPHLDPTGPTRSRSLGGPASWPSVHGTADGDCDRSSRMRCLDPAPDSTPARSPRAPPPEQNLRCRGSHPVDAGSGARPRRAPGRPTGGAASRSTDVPPRRTLPMWDADSGRLRTDRHRSPPAIDSPSIAEPDLLFRSLRTGVPPGGARTGGVRARRRGPEGRERPPKSLPSVARGNRNAVPGERSEAVGPSEGGHTPPRRRAGAPGPAAAPSANASRGG